MTSFFIVPYKPTGWNAETSELKIDPEWYRRHLMNKWPKTRFSEPVSDWYVLQWSLRYDNIVGPICGLQKNLQVVSMSAPFEEYILWHRQIISRKFSLYLISENSGEYLELSVDTTQNDIEKFLKEKSE